MAHLQHCLQKVLRCSISSSTMPLQGHPIPQHLLHPLERLHYGSSSETKTPGLYITESLSPNCPAKHNLQATIHHSGQTALLPPRGKSTATVNTLWQLPRQIHHWLPAPPWGNNQKHMVQPQVASALFLDIEGAFPNTVTNRLIHNLYKWQILAKITSFVQHSLRSHCTHWSSMGTYQTGSPSTMV